MGKAKEICERVYAVGGPGLSSGDDCCVYLVDAGADLVLIDAGAGGGLDRILSNVRSAGYEPHLINHVVATHCHIDHIGGLHPLVNLYGPKVIAHIKDSVGIEERRDDLTAARMYGLQYQPVKIDIMLNGQDEVRRIGDIDFHFLHTPGHTPGSIAPYVDLREGRVLFGQDIHGPFSSSWGSDLSAWRESMNSLLSISADILCEGHAGVFRGEQVRKYIERHIKRYSK
jgi:glyoxylase-like metal-dependent hydrolase (beta-lactamase superfamily II)